MENPASIVEVLPEEILFHIVLMLPPKDLYNAIHTWRYVKELFKYAPHLLKGYTFRWLGITNDWIQEQAYRNEIWGQMSNI